MNSSQQINKIRLNFDPTKKTEILLRALPNERALDVLVRRYALKDDLYAPETLESIGQKYGITRERVRQIEQQALKALRKSSEYEQVSDALRELGELIQQSGGVIPESELIELLDLPENIKRHVIFLLHVGDPFAKHKETNEFTTHWYTDHKKAETVRQALRRLARQLQEEGEHVTYPESEIIKRYINHIEELQHQIEDETEALKHLLLSKRIDKNPLGEWGLAHSPVVKIRGIKDFAYLVLLRNGSPMHFSEVARQIEELFGRPANPATVHNELIKDDRFVLVGRGIYALTEWGYTRGTIKDVIKSVLENEGALSKEDIVERVKRERYVKDGTILINLQDKDWFEKTDSGLYVLKASKSTGKEDESSSKSKTKKKTTKASKSKSATTKKSKSGKTKSSK